MPEREKEIRAFDGDQRHILIIKYSRQLRMLGKENTLSRAISLPAIDEHNLQEAMEILFAHQKNCQKTGKYLQAEAVKKKLIKMKSELQRQRRGELVGRFEEERAQVQAAHQEQMAQFHKYWDCKYQEYHDESLRLQADNLARHQQEEDEFAEVVQNSIPLCTRETSEIINLRRMEEQLAKQEDYVGAHKVQRQVAELERKENEKWLALRNGKIRNLLSQLQAKQAVELSALRQKITQGGEEQAKLRRLQEEKLVQKFCNFMKELQNKHNQEIIKLEKSFKLQSNISFSRSQASSRVLQSRN